MSMNARVITILNPNYSQENRNRDNLSLRPPSKGWLYNPQDTICFISNDEIKDSDNGKWCIWDDNVIDKYTGGICTYGNPKIIIASTDPSLQLPGIPITWIYDVFIPSNGSVKEVELQIEPKYDIETFNYTKHDLVFDDNGKVVIVNHQKTKTEQPLTPKKMHKNKEYFYGFWFAIPHETIIEFIHINNPFDWKWNHICDMLNNYIRDNKNDLEFPEAFPLIELGEENPQTIQYWFEQFLETYKTEINNNTVYLIITPN